MRPSSDRVGRRTTFSTNRELPDRCTGDVTLPCVSDLTSSRCQCLSPSQGLDFSHETIRRSTVGMAGFEPATFCPPDRRAKPGCATSRNLHVLHLGWRQTTSQARSAQVASSGIPLERRHPKERRTFKSCHGRRGGTRTLGLCCVRAALLPLSYSPLRNAGCHRSSNRGFSFAVWSERGDSNSRYPAPKAGAIATRRRSVASWLLLSSAGRLCPARRVSTPMGKRPWKRQQAERRRATGGRHATALAPSHSFC